MVNYSAIKKCRTFIAIIICLCLLVSCLSACGKEDAKPTSENQKMSEKAEETSETSEGKSGEKSGETSDVKSEENSKEKSEENSKEKSEEKSEENPDSDIPSPSVCGKLSVKGTQLVDEQGKTVQLRGLSTHGLSFYPQYVNEELFGQLRRDWKANVIRLAMYTAEYGGYCTGGDKENLKDLIRKGVEYATNQDMYVIVDWHILSDGNPNKYKAEAKDFFEQMSKEFSDHNNVIYEICNEPNGGTSWGEIKSYAREIIPVIRANAPDAVILVGTPNWSQYVNEAAADPITGYDNIMYTLHFYAATHKDDLRKTMTKAIDAGLPVFVSEYGICDASGNGGIDKAQANAWVKIMNKYKVSYVAWNISNKDETSAILKSSVKKTSGFTKKDLSASGKWLYRTLTGSDSPSGSGKSGSGKSDSAKPDSSQSDSSKSDSSKSPAPPTNNSQPPTSSADSSHINVTAVLTNSWESNGRHFYQYTLTVKNTSDRSCENWEVDLKFSDDISLSDGWNGKYSVHGKTLHISSMDYNGRLSAGGSAQDVGFIISGAAGLKLK